MDNYSTLTNTVSIFKKIDDTKVELKKWTLDDYLSILSDPDPRLQKDGYLFSPAIYAANGVERSNDNVLAISALVADCDESHTLDQLRALIEKLGIWAVIVSTHRHGEIKNESSHAPGERYRVVFPLENPIHKNDWAEIWERFNILFGRAMDQACKDLSRAYYLPSHPPEQGFVFKTFEGRLITIEDLPKLPANFYEPEFSDLDKQEKKGRAGDFFNEIATNETTAEILEDFGWYVQPSSSGTWRATRPDKDTPGISATIGHYGPGLFHNFSSETEHFKDSRCYKPFTIFALVEHDGDFKAAALAVVEKFEDDERFIEFNRKHKQEWIAKKRAEEIEEEIANMNTNEQNEEEKFELDETGEPKTEKKRSEKIYTVVEDKTYFIGPKKLEYICDWVFKVVGEISSENGPTICEIEGKTCTGKKFSFTATQDEISDARAFQKICRQKIGSGFVLNAGKEKHLAPVLDTFTNVAEIKQTRKFARAGWTDNREFLIEGMTPENVICELPRELAYAVRTPKPDENEYVKSLLSGLFSAHKAEISTVSIAFTLLAPLARLIGWHDEKFALFLTGRSGVFKTSFAQMALSIYGDFGHDDKLLRFGNGGTVNALMTYPASACDLPLMIDNFKPETGNGRKDAQTLVHGLIEGTEKKRCNQDGSLRKSRELGAWMLFTGEDTISDTASVARQIICEVRYDSNENEGLSWVQEKSTDLPLVGGAWLSWLIENGQDLQDAIKDAKSKFGARRGKWVTLMRKSNNDMVNALRVATSLTLLESAWDIASKHPVFSETLEEFEEDFLNSLENISSKMAQSSAESHECIRFINALKALLDSRDVALIDRYENIDSDDRRALIGWKDDDSIYLNPELSFAAALKFLSQQGGLNGVSPATIWKQLDQLGYLESRDGAHMTVKRAVGSCKAAKRVVLISRSKFSDVVEKTDESEIEDEETEKSPQSYDPDFDFDSLGI